MLVEEKTVVAVADHHKLRGRERTHLADDERSRIPSTPGRELLYLVDRSLRKEECLHNNK